MYCVILAGGSGTRFWPLSRRDNPKQLLNIVGNNSMLQITVDRLRKINFVEDIFIVTRSDLAEKISNTIDGISKENIIVEPSGKNTAPCIGLSALHLEMLKKDAVIRPHNVRILMVFLILWRVYRIVYLFTPF